MAEPKYKYRQQEQVTVRNHNTLRKRLRIRSVISVHYNYITVLCLFNFLIRF